VIRSLRIAGQLEFATVRNTVLNVGNIRIQPGAPAEGSPGVEDVPHDHDVEPHGAEAALVVGSPEEPVRRGVRRRRRAGDAGHADAQDRHERGPREPRTCWTCGTAAIRGQGECVHDGHAIGPVLLVRDAAGFGGTAGVSRVMRRLAWTMGTAAPSTPSRQWRDRSPTGVAGRES
jgi:hypothetical protein